MASPGGRSPGGAPKNKVKTRGGDQPGKKGVNTPDQALLGGIRGSPLPFTMPVKWWDEGGAFTGGQHPPGANFCALSGCLLKGPNYSKTNAVVENKLVHSCFSKVQTKCSSAYVKVYVWIPPRGVNVVLYAAKCSKCSLDTMGMKPLVVRDYHNFASSFYDIVTEISQVQTKSHSVHFSLKGGEGFGHWTMTQNNVLTCKNGGSANYAGAKGYDDLACFAVYPRVLFKIGEGYLCFDAADKGFDVSLVNSSDVTQLAGEGFVPAYLVEQNTSIPLSETWFVNQVDGKLHVAEGVVGDNRLGTRVVYLRDTSPALVKYYHNLTNSEVRQASTKAGFKFGSVQHREGQKVNQTIDEIIAALEAGGSDPKVQTSMDITVWQVMQRKFGCLDNVAFIFKENGRNLCYAYGTVFCPDEYPSLDGVFEGMSKYVVLAEFIRWQKLLRIELSYKESGSLVSRPPIFFVTAYCSDSVKENVLLASVKASRALEHFSPVPVTQDCFPSIDPDEIGLGKRCIKAGLIAEREAQHLFIECVRAVHSSGLSARVINVCNRTGDFVLVVSSNSCAAVVKWPFGRYAPGFPVLHSGSCYCVGEHYLCVTDTMFFFSPEKGGYREMDFEKLEMTPVGRVLVDFPGCELVKEDLQLLGYDCGTLGEDSSVMSIPGVCVVRVESEVKYDVSTVYVHVSVFRDFLKRFCLLAPVEMVRVHLRSMMRTKVDLDYTYSFDCGHWVEWEEQGEVKSRKKEVTLDCVSKEGCSSVLNCKHFNSVCSVLGGTPSVYQLYLFKDDPSFSMEFIQLDEGDADDLLEFVSDDDGV